MTIPNVVVSAPSQLFTLPNSFAAIAGGSIYIGQIDTDPTVTANQIQVYVQNDDGSATAVSQPLIIGAGGYPEYNGTVAKFVTEEGQSMAILDANGVQQFYYPNILKYDPDQLILQLGSPDGFKLIGECPTIADLRNLSPSIPSQSIIVSRYAAGLPKINTIYWYDNTDSTSSDNGCTVIVTTGGQRWKLIFDGPLDVMWCGAGTGVDDLPAFLRAFEASSNIVSSYIGTHYLSDVVTFVGIDGPRFSGQGRGKTIISSNSATWAFDFQYGMVVGPITGLQITNCTIKAANGIRINDKSKPVSDTPPDNVAQPYILAPQIINVEIEPQSSTSGTGYGIEWTKCFDGLIQACYIHDFSYNVHFYGTDISLILNTRIAYAATANIQLDRTGTFGSGTVIQSSECLSPRNGASASIQSNDRDLYVLSTYFECQTAVIQSVIHLQSISFNATIQNNRIEIASGVLANLSNWLIIDGNMIGLNVIGNHSTGSSLPAPFFSFNPLYYYNPNFRQLYKFDGLSFDGLNNSLVPFNSTGYVIEGSSVVFSPNTAGLDANNYGQEVACIDGAFILPYQNGGLTQLNFNTQLPLFGTFELKIIANADAPALLDILVFSGSSLVINRHISVMVGINVLGAVNSVACSDALKIVVINNDSVSASNIYLYKIIVSPIVTYPLS